MTTNFHFREWWRHVGPNIAADVVVVFVSLIVVIGFVELGVRAIARAYRHITNEPPRE